MRNTNSPLKPSTLTDYERWSQSFGHNIADGHANQEWHAALERIPKELPKLFSEARGLSLVSVENSYLEAFSALAQAPSALEVPFWCISPTASNSIDIVAAYLASKKIRTALIEPTFDNLALILRRRAVDLVALAEHTVFEAANHGSLELQLAETGVKALFLVNPNNPTGAVLGPQGLRRLAKLCAANSILLVIDRSFRFFAIEPYDDYGILQDEGCQFIVFEDTGKVWPTSDLKVSLLMSSSGPAPLLNEIYNELYLCHSPFAIALLRECMRATYEVGLKAVIWDSVQARRNWFRDEIAETRVTIEPSSVLSSLPVEWLNCSGLSTDDLCLTEELKRNRVFILPGRQFYWASQEKPENHYNLRISMLKPEVTFRSAIRAFSVFCESYMKEAG